MSSTYPLPSAIPIVAIRKIFGLRLRSSSIASLHCLSRSLFSDIGSPSSMGGDVHRFLLSIRCHHSSYWRLSCRTGYYPAALADVFFAKKLGIKLPSTYKLVFQASLSSIYNHNSLKNSSSIIDMKQCFAEQSGVLGFRKPIYEPLNTVVTPISVPSVPSCLSTYH